MTRSLSDNGLNLIKQFEGCRLTAYKCVPTERYYTIGYGHYGSDVYAGMVITQEQADDLLRKDCSRFVAHVNTYMDTYNFNQNQFDALVSFAYNVGNINQLTKNGRLTISQIATNMLTFNKSNGVTMAGLVNRRNKEFTLFISEPTHTIDNKISGDNIAHKNEKENYHKPEYSVKIPKVEELKRNEYGRLYTKINK